VRRCWSEWTRGATYCCCRREHTISARLQRAATIDQNLILMDEATIYNSSHLFGLFFHLQPTPCDVKR
jgi:hypothetical protein